MGVLNHVGLCVTDLDRSARFYTAAFGFEPDGTLDPPDGVTSKLLRVPEPVGLRVVYLRLGDFRLELLAFERPGNPPAATRVVNEPGLTHLSLGVADIPAACAKVAELGGEVLADTDLGMAVFVRDPDGQLLELLQS